MRKNVFGRQLKRDANERKALFKGLMSSLILENRIKTTEEKAKAIKGQVEKLVTKVKKGGENSRRLLGRHLMPQAIDKLIKETAPLFEKRPGGYTRIVRLGRRFSDDANMVILEWVETGIKNLESKIQNEEPKKITAPKSQKPKAKEKIKTVKKTKSKASTKTK